MGATRRLSPISKLFSTVSTVMYILLYISFLQIHDEVVLEGPEETAEEAAKLVRSLLENPFKQPLKVKMSVDLNIGDSWSEAK